MSTTKYSVGLKFALDSGSTSNKTFGDLKQSAFDNTSKLNDLKTKYPKIVAGTAKQFSKTTTVTEDIA